MEIYKNINTGKMCYVFSYEKEVPKVFTKLVELELIDVDNSVNEIIKGNNPKSNYICIEMKNNAKAESYKIDKESLKFSYEYIRECKSRECLLDSLPCKKEFHKNISQCALCKDYGKILRV